MCQDEERTNKNPLQENQEILLCSARKPRYRSAERVKVSLALIIEEVAEQRDCAQTSECTVANTEALNWKQADMKARRAAQGNQWQIQFKKEMEGWEDERKRVTGMPDRSGLTQRSLQKTKTGTVTIQST